MSPDHHVVVMDRRFPYLCSNGHASADQKIRSRVPRGHHPKLAGRHEGHERLDLLLQRRLVLVLGLVGIRGSIARRSVAEPFRRHGGSGWLMGEKRAVMRRLGRLCQWIVQLLFVTGKWW